MSPPAAPLPASEELDDAQPRRRGRGRGARIVAAGFLGHLFAIGTTISIFGVFVEPVTSAFAVGMAAVAFGPFLYQSVNALTAPFVGRLLARTSIRAVMVIGAILVGSGLIAISRVPTLPLAALCWVGLVSPGAVLLGSLPSSTLIANWFIERRGRALGLAAAGITCAGIVFPPLAAWLIQNQGWRGALFWLGLGVVSIAAPLVGGLVINRPEDVGEGPDGSPSEAPRDPGVEAAGTRSTREILRDRNLWVVGVSFGLVFGAGGVVVIFIVPFGMELGLSLESAALLLSLRSAMGVLGKVTLGSLSDRWGQRPVLWLAMGVQLVMWSALVTWPGIPLLIIASIAQGFTGGPLYPLRNALIASTFGRHSFAPTVGLLSPVQFPFALLTPLAGWLFDRIQDYALTFAALIPVYLVAPLLLLLVRTDAPAAMPSPGAG